ncbi:MAG: hypothetical protein AAB836_00300 [Patescibacteria group bacterium]
MRVFLFNLIFVFYAWLLQPYVSSLTDVVINNSGTNPILGILILAILFLEIWAFRAKLSLVLKRVAHSNDKVHKLIYLLLFSHVFVGFFLLAVCVESLGLSIKDKSIGKVFYFILICREIPFFYFLHYSKRLKVSKDLMSQENLADIALLIYACIAYTIAWESLGLKGVFSHINYPEYTSVELLIVSIFALLFTIFVLSIFLSFRIPYVIEELATVRSIQEKIYFYSSLFLAFVAMVFPLF